MKIEDIKVGGKYRIVNHRNKHWNEEGGMDKHMGTIVTIRKISSANRIKIEEDYEQWNGWNWAPEDFEPIERAETVYERDGKIAVITLEGGVWSDGNKKLATDPKIVEWLLSSSQVKEDGDETHCFIDSDTDEMESFVTFMRDEFSTEIWGYDDMHFVLNWLPKGTKFILFENREYDWDDWVENGDFKCIEHLIIINENNLMEV